ncbi:FHA domain-containing protein DDL [Elsinoe australis]|uniref:FHA domain-containing protein DDL n=1 Tax=Elsinoe australis TaxID=40998 RepID=A0A2P8A9Z9_9PEZI|nr:FHA domain-containing protein DDL [Elsinoe australis]
MGKSGEGYERSRNRSNSLDRNQESVKRKSHRGEADRERKRRRYSSDEEDRPRRRDDGRAEMRSERRDGSREHDRRQDRDRRRKRSPSPRANDRDRRLRRRDDDKEEDRYRRPRQSRSRSPRRDRRPKGPPSPSPPRRNKGPLPSQNDSFALTTGEEPAVEKQKPNFAPTGLLAKEANTVRTDIKSSPQIILKYHEPPEARKPPASQAWRLYHFSGDSKEPADTVPLFERSCWLLGRESTIVDIRLDERTASKQHAVIQFRYSMNRDEYGDKIEKVKPYLIDLESKAGTTLNGGKIEEGRYVELRDGDVLVFGQPDEEGEEWVVMLPPED